jgi:hypothetical protein
VATRDKAIGGKYLTIFVCRCHHLINERLEGLPDRRIKWIPDYA